MEVEVNTREYMAVLEDMVDQGMEVTLNVSGTSMEPFLVHKRDSVYLGTPTRPLRAGDVVCYRRRNGQYVMHRIMKRRGNQFFLAGDHQTTLEGPVEREQIFAVMLSANRNGRWITENDGIWKYYANFWRWSFWIRKAVARWKRIW